MYLPIRGSSSSGELLHQFRCHLCGHQEGAAAGIFPKLKFLRQYEISAWHLHELKAWLGVFYMQADFLAAFWYIALQTCWHTTSQMPSSPKSNASARSISPLGNPYYAQTPCVTGAYSSSSLEILVQVRRLPDRRCLYHDLALGPSC